MSFVSMNPTTEERLASFSQHAGWPNRVASKERFVKAMVASVPHPTVRRGQAYGREPGPHGGIRELMNVKTVWIGD